MLLVPCCSRPAMVSMYYYYANFEDDGQRCSIASCGNRVQLFGRRDAETNWLGYCSQCNARWHAWRFNFSIATCNRFCAIRSLDGFLGISSLASSLVRQYSYVCHLELRRGIHLRHEYALLHLLWLCQPVDHVRLLDDDIDSMLMGRSLASSRFSLLCSDDFARACFPESLTATYGIFVCLMRLLLIWCLLLLRL